jgi:hypothetical protein
MNRALRPSVHSAEHTPIHFCLTRPPTRTVFPLCVCARALHCSASCYASDAAHTRVRQIAPNDGPTLLNAAIFLKSVCKDLEGALALCWRTVIDRSPRLARTHACARASAYCKPSIVQTRNQDGCERVGCSGGRAPTTSGGAASCRRTHAAEFWQLSRVGPQGL